MAYTSIYLFICAATAATVLFGSSEALNNITDREALLDIKASITDDPSGIMRLWNDSAQFCDWYGVTCGNRHQRVIELDLQSSNLTGTIPPSVGNLSFISILTLTDNNFKGTLPPEMGRLYRLQYLLLDTNNLNGIVPSSIFNNISSLIYINLDSNNFEGNLPPALGNLLPNLTYFNIHNNNFSGSIPASISNISGLSTLVLAHNKFRGQVPSNLFEGLENLKYVFLFDNFLGIGDPATDLDFVSSMANSTNLLRFVVGNNHFSGAFPSILCNFSMLDRLIMGENQLTGEIPSCIGENLVKLQAFDLRENNLVGAIPQTLGSLPTITAIDLSANQLSGSIPSSLGNLTELLYLVLDVNNLHGIIPQLGKTGNLIGLDLSYNNFSGSIPAHTLQLSSLSVFLNLSNNHFTGPLSDQVGSLVNLGVLDISQNMLSGEIPASLGACRGLYGLYLEGNLLSGTIPTTLVNKGLQFLDLSRNNLSGTIPKFQQGGKLLMLNLSYNNLQGEVPTSGVFRNANGFSVFGNAGLCGGIPELNLKHCNISKDTSSRRFEHKNHRIRVVLVLVIFGFILLAAACVSLYYFFYRKKPQKTTGKSDLEAALPNLSYQMLHEATNGFSSENLLGSGASGVVYKGTLDQNVAKVFAIKIFNLGDHGASKSFVAECNALRNIRHRNLIKVITVCSSLDYQGNDFKALVYEYMVNGSLDDWLHPQSQKKIRVEEEVARNLNLHQRLEIAVDIAFALEYLHHHCGNSSVIHCDLKPSNVLLDEDMVARVGDFGLAKMLSQGISISGANQFSSTGVRGTIGYAPPEYGVGNEVSTSGDVYSYGILLLELFTGKRPTDEILSRKGTTLHQFVEEAISEQDIKIVDNALLPDILGEDSNSQTLFEALISVFEVALTCSSQVPRERPDMTDVSAKVLSIRNKIRGLLGT